MNKFLNVLVTYAVMRGVAVALASTGKSSAFIAQGRGPNPNENAAIYTIRLTHGLAHV